MSGEYSPSQQVLIGVVGVTGSGKSDFIKRLTLCQDIIVGDESESQTEEVQQYAMQHNGTTYVLVDTPGFDDSREELDDEAVFKLLARWLVDTYRSQQRLNGLIYLLPITNTRQRGSEIRNQRMIKKIIGDENFGNVMLGLTFCDVESPTFVQSRKKELVETESWWGHMIKRGAVVEEIPYADRSACLNILERFAPREKMTLRLQSEVVDQGKTIDETEAARTVAEGIARIRVEFKEKIANVMQSFGSHRAKAAMDKKRRMEQLGQTYEQQMISYRQQEAALVYRQRNHAEEVRQANLLLEQAEKKNAEETRRKQIKLQELNRQTEAEEQRLRKLEQSRRQHALRHRAFHSELTTSLAAVNSWGKNGTVRHGRIKGHDMLGLYCDQCLVSPFPREGHIFVCEQCFSDGNNPVHGRDDNVRGLMLCSDCKADGHRCYCPSDTMTKEPISVCIGLSGCHRFGDEKEIRCKKCRDTIDDCAYLHCCVCEADNFDLCISCWGRGAGCRCPDHTLHVLNWCPPRFR